jgi:hypothetical protein
VSVLLPLLHEEAIAPKPLTALITQDSDTWLPLRPINIVWSRLKFQ